MTESRLANLLIAAIIVLLPLAGATERLAHPAPWLGYLAGVVILLSQPPLGPKQMVSDRGDRISGLVIFLGMIGSVVVGIVDFGYRSSFYPDPASLYVVVGSILTVVGLVVRLWAIRTLGRFFTSTVQIQDDHAVVSDGPYRWLRHPSYTGALMAIVGVTIALASVWGLAIAVGLAFPAYVYRCNVEEQALLGSLGEPYRQFQACTWRLIPFIY